MVISKHIRLFRSSGWRYAHKDVMPTWKDWILLLAILLLMSGGSVAIDTLLMRAEAKEAIDTTTRVVGCLNGQRTLGSYVEKDGSRWEIVCSVSERRARL